MKFNIEYTNGAGGDADVMGSSLGIPKNEIVTFEYNITQEELNKEMKKTYGSSEGQKTDDLIKENNSIKQYEERRQKEREQTRELLTQIEIAEKKKQINDKIKKSRPEKPDICVICLNNIGYEDSFENNVSYLFKGFSGDIWIVEDMNGEDREIFAERFEVVEVQPPWRLIESTMTLVYDPPSDIELIECEDCNGTGMTMEMKCYGDSPIEVDVECPTCNGEGVIEVPAMKTLSNVSSSTADDMDIDFESLTKMVGDSMNIPKYMQKDSSFGSWARNYLNFGSQVKLPKSHVLEFSKEN